MLDKLKIKLNIKVDDRDKLLEEILEDATNLILLYTNLEYIEDSKLETIVIMLAMELFNTLGKEGLVSQNTNGFSQSFKNTLLENYKPFLDEYKKKDERMVKFF